VRGASSRGHTPGFLFAALASCVLTALAALFIVADVRAQSRPASRAASTQPRLRVSGDGRNIAFVERGRAHTLTLGDKVSAARIEEAKLLLGTQREEFTYLLIDVCGLSKRTPDDRMCGAGQECNVVWVKLDRRRKVADARSELYESCWLPVSAEEGPAIVGRRLLLKVDDLREWIRKEVGYDADRPDEGLTLKSSAMPGQRPQ
jgi:hypothetical protein